MTLDALRIAAGRKFARAVTVAVTRSPKLWPVFRKALRRQFQSLAPRWDTIIGPEHLAPLEAALDSLDSPPAHVLDVGTGTGVAALAIARRFAEAEVTGVDIAEAMVAEASRKTPPGLEERVRFEVGDASRLPYPDDAFDLVVLANMIPFFGELARIVAPGGAAIMSFSGGAGTPIYVPVERLRAELGRRGFAEFADFEAGNGTALLARRPKEA